MIKTSVGCSSIGNNPSELDLSDYLYIIRLHHDKLIFSSIAIFHSRFMPTFWLQQQP